MLNIVCILFFKIPAQSTQPWGKIPVFLSCYRNTGFLSFRLINARVFKRLFIKTYFSSDHIDKLYNIQKRTACIITRSNMTYKIDIIWHFWNFKGELRRAQPVLVMILCPTTEWSVILNENGSYQLYVATEQKYSHIPKPN